MQSWSHGITPSNLRTPTVVVLVDFDNFYFNAPLANGESWLTHEFNEILATAMAIDADASSVLIRMYGGWLEDGFPSRKASELMGLSCLRTFFPLAHPNRAGTIDGEVTVVTRSIELPGIEWQSTLKSKRGLPRLRLAATPLPDLCQTNSDQCPVKVLHRISRKKTRHCNVAGCSLTASDAFQVTQQKMVDALLCCDLLAVSGAPDVRGVVVMTNDLDILPAIVTARWNTTPLVLVRHDCGHDASEDVVLQDHGVDIREWRIR